MSANAQMGHFELNSDEVGREIVLTVPLPVERPRPGPERPRLHRYRGQDLALAARIRPFRTLHDLTQADVAAMAGAASDAVVAEWERGVNVPSGMRKRHLVELLEGRRWRVLRAAVVAGDGLPERWERAVRWYRRASREVGPRLALADPILSTLKELRALSTVSELRERYRDGDTGWPAEPAWSLPPGVTARLVEDCAYGLRWVELAERITLDVRRSLVPQVPLSRLLVVAGEGLLPRRRRSAKSGPA